MATTITKWCHSGKDQYDIELLEELNPHRKSLMEVAEKHKNEKGKNIPSWMIINHFTKKYPHLDLLEGPIQIEYLVGETPNGILRIYNIHDWHRQPEKCNNGNMRVNEWILQVLKSADVFVDVFLEDSPPMKTFFGDDYSAFDYEFGKGTLHDIVMSLRDCIREKKNCPAPNARIHGVDVRTVGNVLKSQTLTFLRRQS